MKRYKAGLTGDASLRAHLASTRTLPLFQHPTDFVMTRFAVLAAFVSALIAVAVATPIAGEETQALEKRVTHTGQVCRAIAA